MHQIMNYIYTCQYAKEEIQIQEKTVKMKHPLFVTQRLDKFYRGKQMFASKLHLRNVMRYFL